MWGVIAFVVIGIAAVISPPKGVGDETPSTVTPGGKTRPEASNENVAEKIKVLGSTVTWKPSEGNPTGPKVVWVLPKIKNESSVAVGVIYAKVEVFDAKGEKIGGNDAETIYRAEKGSREKLAPGKTFAGDANDQGDPYVPMSANGDVLGEQKVTVKIEVTGAYADTNTGSKGQPLN